MRVSECILCHIQDVQFFAFLFSDGISRKNLRINGRYWMPRYFRWEVLNSLKKRIKVRKNCKFFNQLFLTWKKLEWITFYLVKLKKSSNPTRDFSKVLLSTNQNRAFLKKKFLSFLISTNQSRLLINRKFLSFLISTNQSRALNIRKLLSFLISTNQNRAFIHM